MSEPRRLIDRSLVQLTLVRFREFIREPEAVFWTFVFPVLLAIGLGIAFRNKPAETLQIGATTPELASALRSEKTLSVRVLTPAAGDRALTTGRIVLLAIPRDGRNVVFRYDDTNPDGRTARLLADRAIEHSAGLRSPVAASDSIVREPGSRYIDFLVPGLLGMNLMGSGMWGIGFSIVDARRKKLLKRLIASPMSRAEYLLSFLLSRLVLLLFEVIALVGFAALLFGVPVRGPFWELGVLCLAGSLAFSALGLLVASRAQTIEAASGLMNFVMLPMWIFSGVFFSAERFPAAIQPFIQALPLTAAINVLRACMLEGTPLARMTGELGILALWLAASFLIALRIFRWR